MEIVDIENIKDLFAKNLERLRKFHDLTQAELALNLKAKFHGIKVERNAIVSYETKKALPRMDVLCCIAAYFNVTVDQILKTDITYLDKRYNLYQINEQILKAGNQVQISSVDLDENSTSAENVIKFLQSVIDVTFKKYADANKLWFMQIALTKRIVERLMHQSKSKEERDEIVNMFKKESDYCLVESTNILSAQLSEILDERERKIFEALKKNEYTLDIVASAYGLSEVELINMLVVIQNKITEKYTR